MRPFLRGRGEVDARRTRHNGFPRNFFFTTNALESLKRCLRGRVLSMPDKREHILFILVQFYRFSQTSFETLPIYIGSIFSSFSVHTLCLLRARSDHRGHGRCCLEQVKVILGVLFSVVYKKGRLCVYWRRGKKHASTHWSSLAWTYSQESLRALALGSGLDAGRVSGCASRLARPPDT